MRTCFDQLRPSRSFSIHFSAKNQILALLELDLRGLEEMIFATETRPHFVSGSTNLSHMGVSENVVYP